MCVYVSNPVPRVLLVRSPLSKPSGLRAPPALLNAGEQKGRPPRITAEQFNRLRTAVLSPSIFAELDTDQSGFLTLAELQAALAKAGGAVSLEQSEAVFRAMDTNSDGEISLEEFTKGLSDAMEGEEAAMSESPALAAFRELDTDGSGFIDLQELRVALDAAARARPSEEVVEAIFREIDANGDGVISFEEFARVYAKLEL